MKRGLPLKEKLIFFYLKKKVPTTIKLEGGSGVGWLGLNFFRGFPYLLVIFATCSILYIFTINVEMNRKKKIKKQTAASWAYSGGGEGGSYPPPEL